LLLVAPGHGFALVIGLEFVAKAPSPGSPQPLRTLEGVAQRRYPVPRRLSKEKMRGASGSRQSGVRGGLPEQPPWAFDQTPRDGDDPA